MDVHVAEGARGLPWFADGLRFHCTGCGKCCTGAASSVELTSADLERLAAFFEMAPGVFAKKYTRLKQGRRRLIDAPGSTDCVFLKDKACSVYAARPTQCRTYPWWLMNLRDPESWAEAAKECEGIEYPGAALVPLSEIAEQCAIDEANEATLQQEWLSQR